MRKKSKSNDISKISDEAFLRCFLDVISTTPEQIILEFQNIIDDEMKRPITKRDYKTIIECMIEKIKCKRKLKKTKRKNYR